MKRRVIEINKYGPAELLNLKEVDDLGTPKDNEVQIEVHFSGVNFADIIMRLGLYQDAPPKPFVPGYELSGIVTQIGSKVSKFKVGDQVMAGSRFGGYVSHINLPESQVYFLPQGFDLKQGAALPVNFLTSHIALHELARVRQGDKVLLENATGGVGVIAIQMAKATGAEVVGLTSSPSKKAFIESYGAKAYTIDEFNESDEKDFDFILSASGGSNLKRQYKRLAKSGKIACIGLQSAVKNGKSNHLLMLKEAIGAPLYSILKLTMDSKMMGGFNALKYFEDQKWFHQTMAVVESTRLKPYVGDIFPAEKAAEAHRALEQRKSKGKVLIAWKEIPH